ncbi:hypothetical protein JZO73_10215 [Enterococcus plantarum]|uniref:Uncharacterized protein n=1 Tax=Enterococcus plantarum TaxID=1077675 RepID=A0A2W3Z9X9_9ENTE|nr:hypothetical protein [Enterococcus plantarum]MBO0467904.1 hypothetical protein [Enterococcus plantarum]PZL74080.1 hypothetical protein CI088_07725 [Enterococcus plantarum]
MESFEFRWEARVERSVLIEAHSKEEAYKKWANGEYGKTDIDDEDIIGNAVDLDNIPYYINRFEKVNYGSR